MTEILKAILKAKSEFGAVKKNQVNPFFKSKYADLLATLEAVEPVLQANGLVLLQYPDIVDGQNVLVTKVYHAESGECLPQGNYPLRPTKDDPQAMGSAVTYARRYSIKTYFGIADEDDDGNTATGGRQKRDSQTADKSEQGQGRQPSTDAGDKPSSELRAEWDATSELQKSVLIKTGLSLKELLAQAGATDIDKNDIEQVRKYKAKLEVLNKQE